MANWMIKTDEELLAERTGGCYRDYTARRRLWLGRRSEYVDAALAGIPDDDGEAGVAACERFAALYGNEPDVPAYCEEG